jgi:hypothetical protein
MMPAPMTVIFSLSAAFVAWVCYNFLGRPITHFYQLRSETYVSFSSVSATDASRQFGRIGSGLDALQTTTLRPALWFLKWWGYNLKAAARGLIGLSSNFASGPEGDAVAYRVMVQKALKLPIDPEDQQQVDDRRLLKSITVKDYFEE